MKHEWAFKHSVQMINQNPNILPRRQLVPQVIRVPAGNRFEFESEHFRVKSWGNKIIVLRCKSPLAHIEGDKIVIYNSPTL